MGTLVILFTHQFRYKNNLYLRDVILEWSFMPCCNTNANNFPHLSFITNCNRQYKKFNYPCDWDVAAFLGLPGRLLLPAASGVDGLITGRGMFGSWALAASFSFSSFAAAARSMASLWCLPRMGRITAVFLIAGLDALDSEVSGTGRSGSGESAESSYDIRPLSVEQARAALLRANW